MAKKIVSVSDRFFGSTKTKKGTAIATIGIAIYFIIYFAYVFLKA